jgi:hypothetical protein
MGHHCCVCKDVVDIRCYNKGHVARCFECHIVFQPYKGCSVHSYLDGFNLDAKPHADKKKKNSPSNSSFNQENERPADDDNDQIGANAAQWNQGNIDTRQNMNGNPRQQQAALVSTSRVKVAARPEVLAPNNHAIGSTKYETFKRSQKQTQPKIGQIKSKSCKISKKKKGGCQR